MRDIGGGCGEAALAVTQKMQKWRAGMIKDQPVNVLYTLPVTFSLEGVQKKKLNANSN